VYPDPAYDPAVLKIGIEETKIGSSASKAWKMMEGKMMEERLSGR
jgi:hypothetical protein